MLSSYGTEKAEFSASDSTRRFRPDQDQFKTGSTDTKKSDRKAFSTKKNYDDFSGTNVLH